MRLLLPTAVCFALLISCAGRDGLPTDEGSGNDPSFASAVVERPDAGMVTTAPDSPFFAMFGLSAGRTLVDICAGNFGNSPNCIAHVVTHRPRGGSVARHGAYAGGV
jgi:hypothetical protein